MKIEEQKELISGFKHLELLANQVVEGFISGMHKSPFHGFSVEFSEHRLYNPGEPTRHIDWKLYGRTDRMYVKRYEEETNLRCHIVVDASSTMYYPWDEKQPAKHKAFFRCVNIFKCGVSVWIIPIQKNRLTAFFCPSNLLF